MEISPLLGPVVALVAWTLVMLAWLAVSRGAAAKKAGIKLGESRGGRGQDLEGKVAPEAQWKAHNYAHLMEQPTLFYAIVFALVLMGMNQPINVWLAWGYVGFRIAHSIVQATVNIVKYRFALFALSTFCLIGLTVHAAARLMHG
jgi:hypothetical protein